MMKKRKILATLLCLSMALVPLAGCASNSETSSGAESSSLSGQSSEDVSDGQITLRFMWWGGEERNKATLAAIEAFRADYPNVTIEAEYAGYDGYLSKVMTQIASGSLPDIIQMDSPWLGSIINKNQNAFLNINDYKDVIDLSVYDESDLLNYCTFDGVLVGVPFTMNGFVMFTNNTLLENAGITLPEQISWEDLITYGDQLRAYDEKASLLSAAWPEYDLLFRMYVTQHTGKDFMDVENFSPNFDQDTLTDAFTYFSRLFKSGGTPDAEVVALYGADPYTDPDRINGNLAIGFTGPNDWGYCLSSFPEGISAGYTNFPMMASDLANTGCEWRPAQMCCISGGTKYPDQALEFVNYVAKDEETIDALGIQRGIPASSIAQERLISTGVLTQELSDMLAFAKENAGLPYSWVSTDSEIQSTTIEMIQNVVFDEMTPEEAAAEAMRLYQKRLEAIKAGK